MFNNQMAREQLQRIVVLFSSKELPRISALKFIEAPEKPCSKWSLCNHVLMYLAGTSDARTYNQWQEVKRYVRKGSKAFYILAPTIAEEQKHDENGNLVFDEKGNKVMRQFLVGFHIVPVFRVEDTYGQPLPIYKPHILPPLLEVAQKWNVTVKYERIGLAYGAYSQNKNEITLASEDVQTFFHELSHLAQRQLDGQLVSGQDKLQESTAELSAAVLSRLYGYNYDAEAYHYIASYAKDKSPQAVGRLCLQVLGKVQKVLELIIASSEARKIAPLITT